MNASNRIAVAALMVLVTIACAPGASTPDRALFDVSDESEALEFDQRAPVLVDAVTAFAARSYADPSALDEMLAEAQAQSGNDQIIVSADVAGCSLLRIWALPEASGVRVGYEFDPAADCSQATSYRALFIIDETGTNNVGSWDYRSSAPAVLLDAQPGA